jgi:hypothetical protein
MTLRANPSHSIHSFAIHSLANPPKIEMIATVSPNKVRGPATLNRTLSLEPQMVSESFP